jgi:hypothetical protein
MNRCVLVSLTLSLLIGVGCDKTDPTAAPAASAAAVEAPGAEPKTALSDDQVPTEEDFEGEAEQRITAQNQEAALDQLEKEIAEP